MIYDLSEVLKQNEAVEKRLLSMKEDYQKPQMSDEQFEKLYRTMKKAKMSERKERKKQRTIKVAATAAALVGAFVILPNTSATIAHAMEQIASDREAALKDIRAQVAAFSMEVAEKVIRKNLSDDAAQVELINSLVDELIESNKE